MSIKRRDAEAVYHAGIEKTVATLIALDQRIEDLEKKQNKLEGKIASLSKNSLNSSKPPSSDIVKPRNQRRREEREKMKKRLKNKKGGQQGHTKHERVSFSEDELTVLKTYTLEQCPHCGTRDLVLARDQEIRTFDQIDIKKVPVDIIQHQSLPYWCPHCQRYHYKPFPKEFIKEGLFKTNLISAICYLKYKCNVSYSGIKHFLYDILGKNVSVSTGFLAKNINKAAEALTLPYDELLKVIPYQTVLNIDETGHKENGELFWTWVFRSELFVLFKIDKSRGSQVLTEVIGKEFNGVIGCDYFSAYKKFMKDFHVSVQFCLAHLIRELKFLLTMKNKEVNQYADTLLKLIKKMFKIIHDSDGIYTIEIKKKLQKIQKKIIREAQKNIPDAREAQNLAKRFEKHGNAYFTFITTPGMDPTNNIAEQAIRFIVIYRRVSQGTRSEKGRNACQKIWTAIATCAAQGRNVYDFITQAVEAFVNDLDPPSLLYDSNSS